VDFGGFIVEALLIVVSVGCLLVTVKLYAFKRKFAKPWLLLSLPVYAVTILGGFWIHQAYWLDEPMAVAAMQGNGNEVERLLAAGASPNATWEGDSAIELAKKEDHVLIVQLLRRHGARE